MSLKISNPHCKLLHSGGNCPSYIAENNSEQQLVEWQVWSISNDNDKFDIDWQPMIMILLIANFSDINDNGKESVSKVKWNPPK